MGSARGSACKNLAEYTASLKKKKLPKYSPRPHQPPSQAASAPKLSSQVTFFIIFFRQIKYLPLCNKHVKKILQQHFFIFFDADRISAVVGGVLLAAKSTCRPLEIRTFLRKYRKLLKEPAQRRGHAFSDTQAGVRAAQPRDPKCGRFQLNERFNHDQVPLSFVNG